MSVNSKPISDKINYYDDENHNYQDFWLGRDYEHQAELLALNKLLGKKHYALAMDYGGGYGRISPVILEHADRLILVDASEKQLIMGREFLKEHSNVDYVRVDKKDTVPAEDNSIDLLVMVRVSHHLPKPSATFKDIYRALKPGGEAIIEIANEAHFINRLKYMKHLSNVPRESVPVGTNANGIKDNTPFYNHNPKTIAQLMKQNELIPVRKLSVSNLRHRLAKEHLSMGSMLAFEKLFQKTLTALDFGPSIFFLVKKR